ncbi:MAG TPA: sigma 54-interacting transcriptional regulator [Patescibacteria group bacterium]|nr:sigma 54-interacting transcriptional regulator [Patescibacteria group bacterium]
MKADYTILVADDEENVRRLLAAVLKREGYPVEVASDGLEALAKINDSAPQLVLMDIRMPQLDGITAFRKLREQGHRMPVILMTAFAAVDTAVEALKAGAFDYLIKPFDLAEVKLLVNRAFQLQSMSEEIKVLQQELAENYRLDRILTNSPKMKELCKNIAKLAQSNATVLITGESGSGKELIASTIHYNSARKHGPFVKINCGALPENLLESELFGHEKGSFTGAIARRTGRFEQANSGTLFLDEIGEFSLNLQVKLLRVIQEREFERVGGNETIRTDIRVMAATNRNLEEMVARGTFREDLYYRLNVVSLYAPPLRERKPDIHLLADYFLQKYSLENQKEILGYDHDAYELLRQYDWPGNVREMKNVIERAVIMNTGNIIFAEDLPEKLTERGNAAKRFIPEAPAAGGVTLKEMMKNVERQFIREVLENYRGNTAKAARELGISRRSLQYKIQEYQLE